jgi:hypothetical protein
MAWRLSLHVSVRWTKYAGGRTGRSVRAQDVEVGKKALYACRISDLPTRCSGGVGADLVVLAW